MRHFNRTDSHIIIIDGTGRNLYHWSIWAKVESSVRHRPSRAAAAATAAVSYIQPSNDKHHTSTSLICLPLHRGGGGGFPHLFYLSRCHFVSVCQCSAVCLKTGIYGISIQQSNIVKTESIPRGCMVLSRQ